MNAAARTLSNGNIFKGDFSHWLRGAFPLVSVILWVAVIGSALSVVYMKNIERQYVHQMAQLNYQKEQLDIQKAQLLLEKSMWSTPARVRGIAKQNLAMKVAKPEAVIVIQH